MATLFDWSDYVAFALLLLISAVIGIYFGCFGTKQKTTEEYLHGGRHMNVFPVAFSLVATNLAGITLIIIPSEVYTHNILYILCCPASIIGCVICSYFFLPVFFHLELSNSYEYLEFRFSKTTRNVASAIYVLSSLLYLPFTIYVPALAFSQVTGVNIYIISTGVAIVCIFYTAIGGLKAFVWSDFIQTVISIIVTIVLIAIGTHNIGGAEYVFDVANKGRLLDIFDMDPNPFLRLTFWTVVIGSITDTFVALIAQQDSIQRFKSLPTMKDVNIVLMIFWFGVTGSMLMCIYAGVLVYATYFGCDPIEAGIVEEADQIFPYYTLDKIGYIPTISGIFVAGIMCGGLSSLAAVLNTLAGSIYQDYIKRGNTSERRENICMRLIVVILGIYALVSIPVIENMGTILAVLYSIDSITAAPCLSFFVLGMMVPWCNSYGAVCGAISSMLFLTWITIGSGLSGVNVPTEPIYPGVPNTCNVTIVDTLFNFTSMSSNKASPEADDDVFFLYKLSFMYYSTFGTIVNIIVALIVSYFTGYCDVSKIDPNLISPPMRRFLPKKQIQENKVEGENSNDIKMENSNDIKMEKFNDMKTETKP